MFSCIQQETSDEGLAALRHYVLEGGSSIESMRRLSRQQLAKMDERIAVPVSELQDAKMALVRSLKSQPIAEAADEVDSQVYEGIFELRQLWLGPRMKMSTGYWPELSSSTWGLAEAELAMLELYVERAQIKDGQDILDLGCGYGTIAFYLAERFPRSRIVAMTITASHIDLIKAEMKRRGLTNIVPLRADINTYEAAPASFDRIISIELLEYLRNYELLFAKISVWLRPTGLLFIEFTTHVTTCYVATEVNACFTGEESYLSADMLLYFQRNLKILDQWWVNGKHYAATLDAWQEKLSANRDRAMAILRAAYGDENAEVEYRKMEIYSWLSSEEFAFKDGNALGLTHYLFCKPEASEMLSNHTSKMSAALAEGIKA